MCFFKSVVAFSSLLALTACGGPTPQNVAVGDVTIRQVPYSGPNSETSDGKLSLFVFIPVEPRPLETRIALIEQLIEQQGKCRLGTTDRSKLKAWTYSAEGDGQKVLMAPLKC